jgi:hypothetical protein
LFVVAIAAALFGGQAVNAALDLTRRGRKLTSSTLVNGTVQETPADLAGKASAVVGRTVSVEAYALARMIRSEAGSQNGTHKIAVAWVARNDARSHGWSLLFTLSYDRNDKGGKLFGTQAGGRYSTARDPYEDDLKVAEAVLSGDADDPTGGAVKFVHISAFGVQAGTRTYEAVASEWARDGLSPSKVEGAGDDLRVFVKRGASVLS